jgi:cytochrome c oxidase assembly protein Cox11
MEDVTTITLSYSFFKSDSSELDQAMETFYNSDS